MGHSIMLDRLIAILLVWGMSGCFAWSIAHEYALFVNAKLGYVLHALNNLN
jgi:hypothetical protein